MTRSSPQKLFLTLCFLSLSVGSLAACETADMEGPPPGGPSYPQLSEIEPPAPQYEEEPVLPSPVSTVWRPGYWAQSGVSFTWIPGAVMDRPSPTAVWTPSYWARREYGWAYVPGYWQ